MSQTIACEGKPKREKGKHGQCYTKLFGAWNTMIQRCTNPNLVAYPNYGGRGITVCERWMSDFMNFKADMGERPPGMTLERKNNDLGYSPENCVWASRTAQARNSRKTRFMTLNGVTKPLVEWAEQLKLRRGLIARRLELGWSDEKALTTPARPLKRRPKDGYVPQLQRRDPVEEEREVPPVGTD